MRSETTATGRASRVGPAAALGAALFVLLPTLGPGVVLTYDMVFVPRQPITESLLGLGGVVPRAVPSDLVLALGSRVVPIGLLQDLVLVGILVAGGWGAARLVPTGSRTAAAAAAVLYVWNPFVYERLVIGQWSLLVGYAVLPWVLRSAVLLGRRWRWSTAAGLWVGVAVAAAGSPSGGVLTALAAVLAVSVSWSRSWSGPADARRAFLGGLGFTLLAVVTVNAPWWVPSVLRPGGVPTSAAGVDAFASRADTPLGTPGSLLTLGGIWNAQVVPPGRDTWLAVPGLVVLTAVAALGLLLLRRGGRAVGPEAGQERPGAGLLLAVGGLGFVLALAAAVPGVTGVVEAVVTSVPGGGLLRDGQKFIALLAPALAVGFGVGAAALAGYATARGAAVVAAALAVVAPIVVLPALAWGASGRLASVDYPGDWSKVRHVVAADDTPGAVVVLPWSYYRRFAWNGDRTLLDPAPRWLDRRVVTNDALPLADRVVPGEDPLARQLDPLVRSVRPLAPGLRAAGVRFVLVEHRAGTPVPDSARLSGARLVHDGPDLALYAIDAPGSLVDPGPRVPPVVTAMVLAAVTTMVATCVVVQAATRGRCYPGRSRYRGVGA